MRHRKKFNHLSRTSSHRKAMLSNMACSLILHKRIKTTVAKAKALRMYVEPLINKSKTDNTHSRRIVFSHLQTKEAVSELFRDVSEKVANRPGGYTRILKLGNRLGDAAEICYIELVDYNENMLSAKSGGEKKRKRRSRRGGKTSTETVSAPVSEASEATSETTEEGKASDSSEEKKDA
jgi:large subunit ribosomal protein L17